MSATPRPLSPINEGKAATADSSSPSKNDEVATTTPSTVDQHRMDDSRSRLSNLPSAGVLDLEGSCDAASSAPASESRAGSATPVRAMRYLLSPGPRTFILAKEGDSPPPRATTPSARSASPRSPSPMCPTSPTFKAATRMSPVSTSPSVPVGSASLWRKPATGVLGNRALSPQPATAPAPPTPGRSAVRSAIPVRPGSTLPGAVTAAGAVAAATPSTRTESPPTSRAKSASAAVFSDKDVLPTATKVAPEEDGKATFAAKDAQRPRPASVLATRPPATAPVARRAMTPTSLPPKPRPTSAQFSLPTPQGAPGKGPRPLSYGGGVPLVGRRKSLLDRRTDRPASMLETLRRGEGGSSIDVSSCTAGIVDVEFGGLGDHEPRRPVRTGSSSSTSPTRAPERHTAPTRGDEEPVSRPGSSLGLRKRPGTLRFGSFISRLSGDARRLSKSPTPSPLSVVTTLPDVGGGRLDELRSASPVRAAVRLSGTFGIRDDESTSHYPAFHQDHRHRRTSDGSLVEMPMARVLYPANLEHGHGHTPFLDDEHNDQQEELKHKFDATSPVPFSPVTQHDMVLSPIEMEDTPELSWSSSGTASQENTISESSHYYASIAPTSPCSTFVNPPASDPCALLLMASQMLTSHAASLFRHAEMMGDMSRSFNDMAVESMGWGARLMDAASAGSRTVPFPPALGVFGHLPIPPPLDASDNSSPLSPLPTFTSSFHVVPTAPAAPPRPVSPLSPATAAPSRMSFSHGSQMTGNGTQLGLGAQPASLITEVERLGREGWANLHTAEDVWNRAMENLRTSASLESAAAGGVGLGIFNAALNPAVQQIAERAADTPDDSRRADESPGEGAVPAPVLQDLPPRSPRAETDYAPPSLSEPPHAAAHPSPSHVDRRVSLDSQVNVAVDVELVVPVEPTENDLPAQLGGQAAPHPTGDAAPAGGPVPVTSVPLASPSVLSSSSASHSPPLTFPRLTSPATELLSPATQPSALSLPLSSTSESGPSLASMVSVGVEMSGSVSLDDEKWYQLGPYILAGEATNRDKPSMIAKAEVAGGQPSGSQEPPVSSNDLQVHLADAAQSTIDLAPVTTTVTSSSQAAAAAAVVIPAAPTSPTTDRSPATVAAATATALPAKVVEAAVVNDDKMYSFTDMVEVARRPSQVKRRLSLRTPSEGKKRWFGLRWTTGATAGAA